jgi:hypothetical protein
MLLDFESAAGSVTGREHIHALRNNQDAHCVLRTPEALVAVVCDGCSSGRYSEVGAHLGVRLLASELFAEAVLAPDELVGDCMEQARKNTLAELRSLALAMGGRLSETVNDYFLFTVVAVLINPVRTLVVSIGDGFYAVNGAATSLGPFENNAPPYMAYAMTGSSLANQSPHLLRFKVNEVLPTAEIQNLLIGTDGVVDLAAVGDRPLPGKTETVGPLDQFWNADRFFKNPFILGRRLNLINPAQPVVRVGEGGIESHEGLLPDDTTMVVVRRQKGA